MCIALHVQYHQHGGGKNASHISLHEQSGMYRDRLYTAHHIGHVSQQKTLNGKCSNLLGIATQIGYQC